MKVVTTKDKYTGTVVPEMEKKFGYGNGMAVPRILKVVVNVGTGKLGREGDKAQEVFDSMIMIAGQRPVKTKAKKAIAGFKTRQGMEVGVKVTLRGKRMWSFIDRLVNATLPRTKDFQGIPVSSVDANGNLNIGIKEHVIFPEISPEQVKTIFGMQVTVTSTAKSKEEGMELYRLLGFPLKK
ncbi:MAG: hypothetical protein ACD_50C00021G0001 [uncultured bacterium]|nr:MAG: hypothetical protein ACD_50C00021G0001 [uncultured bacterium]